ncbi:MAG TPA: putative porin, partial [Steroidobacteraceae bacterium]|nr:putative porin [Steroidobacteraceae bacterium]
MRTMLRRTCSALLLGVVAALGSGPAPAQSAEERNLEELRNTVVNLLQALVDRGVITREQAEAMVKSAQEKAAASTAAAQQQQKAEQGAVRVPYVPEIVKDEIAKQVETELGPSVKQELVDQVGSKGSLFSALPGWVQRMQWSGDVRVRGELDDFASGNAESVYFNFNAINSAGGIAKAGPAALLNTTEDQNRLRIRARFGFDADLGGGWSTALRLATGSVGQVLATTNQTLGTYGQGYTVTFDEALLRWSGQTSSGRQIFTAYGGRFDNPWVSSDLIWYNDLSFEGVIGNYRLNLSSDNAHRHDLFVTVGGLPLTSFSPFDSNPTDQQKWLLA